MSLRTPDSHYLILDGWQYRRGGGHWQGLLAEQLAAGGSGVDYLTLPDPEHPRYEAWSAAVRRALNGRTGVTVIAHGLSVLLWLRMCGDRLIPQGAVARVLLVAPPAVGHHGGDVSAPLSAAVTAQAVRSAAAEPALVIASSDDPYLPDGAESAYGAPLGLRVVELRGAGHINADSGFGAWPAVQEWCVTGRWPAERRPEERPEEHRVILRADADALPALLREWFRPSGRRLGVLGTVDSPTAVQRAVADAIAAHGANPQRYAALLRPRVSEDALRISDLIDFAVRYGHEYSVTVLDARWERADGGERLSEAVTGSGSTLIWLDETSQSHITLT